MLLSYNLLKRYVDLEGIDAATLAQRLTDCGIEVEEVKPVLSGSHLVSAYVKECEVHPDSDHLHICQVDLGDEVVQIVCGAPNIAKGQYVIVAKLGAKLPEMSIKATSIRGVASQGMICSLRELGLADKFQSEEQKQGIVVLPECQLGIDPREVLHLDDYSLDIKQTPNRSDFMSVFSIAYEVGAIFDRVVRIDLDEGISNLGKESDLRVSSSTKKASYFLAKEVGHIEVKESIPWIRGALIASGIRPINNVVDISNLVMLETGQPLHYYDYDFLNPKTLSVRDDAAADVLALDGHEYHLQKGDLIIYNDETPVGIAGIMGLGNSMIHEKSRGLVIEAARFDRVAVRKTALRLGLNTDSSARFTKPYNANATRMAMDRSIQYLLKYAAASDLGKTAVYGESAYEPVYVEVSLEHINRLLGTDLDLDTVVDIFMRLQFKPLVNGALIRCQIPEYRLDISIAEDLIEEVIRMIGFDILKESLPHIDLTVGSLNKGQIDIRSIERQLLGLDFDQVLSYTLVAKEDTLGGESIGEAIALLSPMSDKKTHLRTHLLPSLLELTKYNAAHQVSNINFFEISKLYAKEKKAEHLALLASGSLYESDWTDVKTEVDFFTMKGILCALLENLGFNEKRLEFRNESFDKDLFHPYQTASIYIDRKRLGVLGHLHPLLCDDIGVKDCVYAEIDIQLLQNLKRASIKVGELPKYPSAVRDLALKLIEPVAVEEIIKVIRKQGGALLRDLMIFDVFELADASISIAFKLTFTSDHTLREEEVTEVLDRIVAMLTSKYKIEVR